LFKHIRSQEGTKTSQLSKVWQFFTISTASEHKAIKEFFALQNTVIGIGYRV